ncbi:unnamed protein product [Caenorhabditis auriculariae]|uniref:Uncharacterized protein n=1 Tax=Caenorhabditis auriculariae TaxID=2777116 RepID=A0A8S1H4P2_9PELO|nr:unnamed protein product [Caenorhabditis auriculariae]
MRLFNFLLLSYLTVSLGEPDPSEIVLHVVTQLFLTTPPHEKKKLKYLEISISISHSNCRSNHIYHRITEKFFLDDEVRRYAVDVCFGIIRKFCRKNKGVTPYSYNGASAFVQKERKKFDFPHLKLLNGSVDCTESRSIIEAREDAVKNKFRDNQTMIYLPSKIVSFHGLFSLCEVPYLCESRDISILVLLLVSIFTLGVFVFKRLKDNDKMRFYAALCVQLFCCRRAPIRRYPSSESSASSQQSSVKSEKIALVPLSA